MKHGIKTGEYFTIKNATINVTSAVGDGINCEEYFLMENGTINFSGTQDDGIQCDIDGDASTGETDDHEDEDSGNVYIEGVTVSGGTSIFDGVAYTCATFTSGSNVTLSSYTGGGGGPGGGGQPGSGGGPCVQ